jgi:GntR family phosphonate transport system transcriptional regulator
MTADSRDSVGPAAFPVQRQGGVTAWRQIADTLRGEIRDRRYAPTGSLPSEHTLAARFKVNRHTLRQALAALRDEGLIRIEQGRGAFIQRDWVDYTVGRRTRFSANILSNRLAPAYRVLGGREERAPAAVAKALGLPRQARVLVAEMLNEASDQPIGLATSYFPAARFPGLLELLPGTGSVTALLGHFGITDYFRAHNRITAQMPDEQAAALLQVPRTRPVLCVESVDVDAQGIPIKYGLTVFSGDRVQVVFDPQARHD